MGVRSLVYRGIFWDTLHCCPAGGGTFGTGCSEESDRIWYRRRVSGIENGACSVDYHIDWHDYLSAAQTGRQQNKRNLAGVCIFCRDGLSVRRSYTVYVSDGRNAGGRAISSHDIFDAGSRRIPDRADYRGHRAMCGSALRLYGNIRRNSIFEEFLHMNDRDKKRYKKRLGK